MRSLTDTYVCLKALTRGTNNKNSSTDVYSCQTTIKIWVLVQAASVVISTWDGDKKFQISIFNTLLSNNLSEKSDFFFVQKIISN